jgi:Zn-dependent peptidase ImmA (M78 family)
MGEVGPVTIQTADLGTVDGVWDPDTRTIWLHRDLTPAQRRCTLAHEVIHAARGDEKCADHVLTARQERLVEEIASRLLVPLPALADALTHSSDEGALCEELHVDAATLRSRLSYLTLDERRFLREHLEKVEHVA